MAYSDGAYIVTSDYLDMIGRELEFTYYTSSGYETSVFRYVNTIQSGFSVSDSSYSYINSQPFLLFRADTPSNLSYDPTAITVRLDPVYSIIETEQINTWIALSSGQAINSDAYQSSTWDWYYSDGGSVRHTSLEYNQSWLSAFWNNSGFIFIPAMHASQSVGSGYASTARFYGAKGSYYGQYMFLAIGVPYVSTDAVASSGTFVTTGSTSPGTGTDINVNVDIDMTETNGILGGIRDILANLGNFIVTGIKNLFIPSQEDLDAFKNTIEQLLRETFGGIPELENQLEDAVSGLFTVTAKTSIHFDGIQFDGHYYVPEQDVSLKPSGYDDLYTFVEMIINILATIATVNTCVDLVKRVVVGEVVVDVD